MNRVELINGAKEHFGRLIEEQILRVERMKVDQDFIDYNQITPIIIGFVGGDGIGPYITAEARRILEFLLKDDLQTGRIIFKEIEGLTIENRAKAGEAIPGDILKELKQCHVILKGPTTTPQIGDSWPNIESANVAMRKELDLFANVRPVKVPAEGINWVFFRENTEGAYALGNRGIKVNDDLALDFTVTTYEGSYRIIKAAFDYASKNDLKRVTVVSKANIIKTTDGMFLDVAREVAGEYPDVEWDSWYIDIMTAKLIDPRRRTQFKVLVLPNLYGDILTDEAAEFQGGVGTAGSANIGKRYAMFEAIHGSAPRMVEEGRAKYADPSSIIKAAGMLLEHIGYKEKAKKIEMALDICENYTVTGRDDGLTSRQFADHLLNTMMKQLS
jgi:isocitrate dehydrogenase (NAD+)